MWLLNNYVIHLDVRMKRTNLINLMTIVPNNVNINKLQELHRKLRPMCSELKNLELPSNSFKFLFGKNDRNTLEKAKTLIQKYLEVSSHSYGLFRMYILTSANKILLQVCFRRRETEPKRSFIYIP